MSHFPDIDAFDAGDITVGHPRVGESPSVDDFLAREQAFLGSDAEMFHKPAHFDSSAVNQNFESSFPDTHEMNEVGGIISSSTAPYIPGQQSSPFATKDQPDQNETEEIEPEVIREWRERQALQILTRDESSEAKIKKEIEAAHQAIDDFYENYNAKKDRAIEQTRKEEADTTSQNESQGHGGSTWEQIIRLIDTSDKATRGINSTSRFRDVLLSLSKDPEALRRV
ncbi:Clathrin light chain [Neolecta irregularis DAH-3]|uniref:Clathrin light chain n=1 Tax=Neolecta irregularis (strain DAH-3) TaxID=1198029 RepID=A0A1U7LRW8_NEOID|nr:Clathrin light chain [Neolecta irregularis DAH-3]|eukprot:OLL25416.1 Clathrin light chain [Neolecta irregularis DAH-3]